MVQLLGFGNLAAQPPHQLYEQLKTSVGAGQLKEAVKTADQLVDAVKKQFGDQHDSVHSYLMMTGHLFYSNSAAVQSVPYYSEALPFHAKSYGENSSEYQDLLLYVANTLFGDRQFLAADRYYEMIRDHRLKKYGASDSMYMDGLHLLANNRNYLGKKQEALDLYYQVQKWFIAKNRPTEDYASLLNWLGSLELNVGDFTKAEKHLEVSYTIYDSLGQKDKVVMPLHNLAILYDNMGLFNKSVAIYDRLLPYYQSTPGNELNYASALTERAHEYVRNGRYALAEEMMKQALDMRRRFNAPPEDLANSMNELAHLYMVLGNTPEAEAMFRQAMDLREKRFGKDEVYAIYLHNLAVTFGNAGRYREAVLKEEEAEAIYKAVAPNSPDHTNTLQYHAYLLLQLGRLKECGDYVQQALATHEQKPLANPYPHELYMVAGIYQQEMKNYAAAIRWFEKANALNVRIFGEDHMQAAALNRLTIANRLAGNYERAFYWQQKTNVAVKKKITAGIEFLSEMELVRLSADVNFTDGPAMIAHYGRVPAAAATLYDNMLLMKGLAVNNQTAVTNSIHASGDTALIRLWNSNLDLKRLVYEQEQLTLSKRSYNIDSLKALAKENEKFLVKRSKLFEESSASLDANWQSVQQKLAEGSCAIEFVRYTNGSLKKDSAMYGAVIIRKTDTVPQFVPLCSEHQLKQLIKRFSNNQGAIYSRGVTITSKGPLPSKALYALVWQPLETKMEGIHTIHFSPDGLLHQLAFAALPVNDSTLLQQRYQLVQLFSTKTISTGDRHQTPQRMVLMGGINYSQSATSPSNEGKNDPMAFAIRNRSSNMSSFNYLPGTLQEAMSIQSLCAANAIQHSIFTGDTATEAVFRQMSGNAPLVIHISTHGFSITDNTGAAVNANYFSVASDPLVRCGLVMAGGNRAWMGKSEEAGTDGILTGKEISTMNLRGCELAVLSACETGLGNIEGTEGVFGLQRALRIAGVKAVIVSLWPVPDKETVEFMESFYTNWFLTGNRDQAFRFAQTEMQKKYEAAQWAAFVMIQ